MKQLTISQIRSRIKKAGIDLSAVHYLTRTCVDVGFDPDLTTFENCRANQELGLRVAKALGWYDCLGNPWGTSLARVHGPTRPTLAYID